MRSPGLIGPSSWKEDSAVIVFSVLLFGNADPPPLTSTKGARACRKGHDDELSGANRSQNTQQSS